MKTWITVAIIAGLLIFAGIMIVVNTQTAKAADQAQTPDKTQCTGCGNGCNANSNCGLATCGAMNGGKCNCGAK